MSKNQEHMSPSDFRGSRSKKNEERMSPRDFQGKGSGSSSDQEYMSPSDFRGKKKMKAGGKVRGCGCAKRGVRKAKMY